MNYPGGKPAKRAPGASIPFEASSAGALQTRPDGNGRGPAMPHRQEQAMKKIIVVICAAMLIGCAPSRVAIPDEPEYGPIEVYRTEGGIYLDEENMEILVSNIKLLREYQERLLKLLRDKQNEEGR